jgi:hypothetical protein
MADDDDHSQDYVPFRPASGPVDQRIATALEYIATQLGEINAKLSHMGEEEYEGEGHEDDDEKEEQAPPSRRR